MFALYDSINNDNGGGGADQNPNGQYSGGFYFANNVSWGNGLNGLVVHKTNNTLVTNNTIYKNGEVPGAGDTEWTNDGPPHKAR